MKGLIPVLSDALKHSHRVDVLVHRLRDGINASSARTDRNKCQPLTLNIMTLILRLLIVIIGNFFSTAVMASEQIAFKQPFSPKNGWLSYAIAVAALLALLATLLKKYKPVGNTRSSCQLIEKKYLGNKTIVYVFEYQQQRFLLADNQQALALHPLNIEGGL